MCSYQILHVSVVLYLAKPPKYYKSGCPINTIIVLFTQLWWKLVLLGMYQGISIEISDPLENWNNADIVTGDSLSEAAPSYFHACYPHIRHLCVGNELCSSKINHRTFHEVTVDKISSYGVSILIHTLNIPGKTTGDCDRVVL